MLFILIIGYLIVSSCYCLKQEIVQNDPITVTIDQGELEGKQSTTDNGFIYYSFLGIPYAQPPVGDLRFKPPQPPLSWEGVRDATQEGSSCLQGGMFGGEDSVSGDEDCLYVNVHTPQIPNNNERLNYSVMVWIHGGGWEGGSGSADMYGPDYLIEEEIVLVSLNYRLGALGFLGLNYSEFSKNNGLKDQVAALQWVKNNIDKFGGNPDEVTIFGESAGGMSVHYHLVSPMSKGLFHRAISESGSSLDSESFANPVAAHDRAIALGNALGYDTSDSAELLDLLMQADAKTIVQKQGSAYSEDDIAHGSHVLIFLPTVEYNDDSFLPDFPVNIVKSGNFNQVPYITGVNSKEGKAFASDYLSDSSSLINIDENFEKYVPEDLGLKLGSEESVAATEEIRTVYFGNRSISEDTNEGLVDFLGDTQIVIGVHRAIKLQLVTGTAPLYVYIFSYEGSLNQHSNYDFPGAAHGDELMYLFKSGFPRASVANDSSEMITIRRMTKIWTNFAKSLDPSTGLDIVWSPLSEENYFYLSIGTDLLLEDLNTYEPEYMAVWDKLYGNIDSIS